jgi:hypothetical protein
MDLSFTLTDTCRIAGVMFLAASLALSGMTNSLRFTLLHGVSGSFSGIFFFFLVMCGWYVHQKWLYRHVTVVK